jgi:16S rRNA (adenine1518-N6/adenine1519-N6)-dimethyltransferase
LRVHQQDVLAFDFGALAGTGGPVRVVGNLPYNISSPLLLHLAQFTGQVVDHHFMLQKEVSDRIVAKPGGDMGRLTVVLQARYEVETLFDVPPESFEPPPKVQSSVIRMLPRPAPLTRRLATLQALLAVGFSQRRKMIRNTLGKWLGMHHPSLDLDAAAAREPLLRPFTESTRRAEEIAVASWCALADRLGDED